MDVDDEDAAIIGALDSLELQASRPVIYDRDIELRLLLEDPVSGAEHYLVRYPAGLTARWHRHTAGQTIVVLEGRLQVNERVVGPGSYCHLPGGTSMHHAPAGSDSCLFLTIFDGPFDVEPIDR